MQQGSDSKNPGWLPPLSALCSSSCGWHTGHSQQVSALSPAPDMCALTHTQMVCVKGQVENRAINRSVGGSGCNMLGLLLWSFLIILCLERDPLLTARQFKVQSLSEIRQKRCDILFKVFGWAGKKSYKKEIPKSICRAKEKKNNNKKELNREWKWAAF